MNHKTKNYILCVLFIWVASMRASNPFGKLQLSPFATPSELEKQYAAVVEQQVSQAKGTQERKDIRAELGQAYKQIQKPADRRIVIYNMLSNGVRTREPYFHGLTAAESSELAERLKRMRQIIGSRLASGGGPNIIDSNETIEKDYEYRKKILNEFTSSQEEKDKAAEAYIVLTEPWRWKEFLEPHIVERMEMQSDQAKEYAQQRAQEEQKKRQNELNEQRERERIAKEKAEAERKTKEAEQEKLKKEQERKKEEQLAKEREEQARETARRNQEEQDRIQLQKEREERERKKAEQAQQKQEPVVTPLEWKAPILTLNKSFKAPEAMTKKMTFELKNKTSNYRLGVELLQESDQKKSVTAAYKDEAIVSASTGKNEEDHGYLRMAGLDPKRSYKLIISLMGQSGALTQYAYELKANKDRKAIILTFEKDGNEFVLRPQKGAFLSSSSQSGLPLADNIKSSDIKSLGLFIK